VLSAGKNLTLEAGPASRSGTAPEKACILEHRPSGARGEWVMQNQVPGTPVCGILEWGSPSPQPTAPRWVSSERGVDCARKQH